VAKCTSEPTLKITGSFKNINSFSDGTFQGTYWNEDTTEKVYSYCFTIFNSANKVIETSGKLLHNVNKDKKSEEVTLDKWTM
jgi:hypothetical protein